MNILVNLDEYSNKLINNIFINNFGICNVIKITDIDNIEYNSYKIFINNKNINYDLDKNSIKLFYFIRS